LLRAFKNFLPKQTESPLFAIYEEKLVAITESDYITTVEAGKILKVSTGRIAQKIRAGRFEGVRACPCGRSFLIPRTEVENHIKGRREKSPGKHCRKLGE
jgi:excisionase family DNA binding protein